MARRCVGALSRIWQPSERRGSLMGVGRLRRSNRHLPRGVYLHHGAYWLVRAGKWSKLGRDFGSAMAEYGRLQAAGAAVVTVSDLIARYSAEVLARRTPITARNRRGELAKIAEWVGHLEPRDVRSADVWDYWRARGEGPAARHEIRALSALLTYARRIGALDGPNPAYGLRLPLEAPRERYVTDEEYLAVRALAAPMVRHAMDLALLCGLDRATVLALERRNITDAGIEFQRGKTKGLQRIGWSDDLREVVEEVLREEPRLRHALICRRDGRRYTPDGFSTLWQRAMAAYAEGGGTRFTFHDIRAKSASDAGSDQEAADRLNHSDPSITRRVYRRLPRLAKPLAWRGKNEKA